LNDEIEKIVNKNSMFKDEIKKKLIIKKQAKRASLGGPLKISLGGAWVASLGPHPRTFFFQVGCTMCF
jgi:hypothetical protein